ncbi:MAG: zinc-ribbon domain-containing protein [Acidobacteriia bacterium]|nr:zinc-ribbon domain-containing protein [Terriglobia bacterium]
MAKYCTSCGAAMDDTARFCTNCGATIAPPQPPQAAPPPPPPPPQYQAPAPQYQQPPQAQYQQPPQAQYQQPQYQQQYQQPPPGYQQPPYQAPPAGAGMQQNVAGMLCYLGWFITGIIFLVMEPLNKERFVRFHAFQSIFTSVAWLVLYTVIHVIWIALPWSLYFIGTILSLLVFWLGGLFLWLFLMYKAYNNEMFKLPVIGDIAMKQAG